MGQIFDWDGTITGKPGSTIVRDQPFYTSSEINRQGDYRNNKKLIEKIMLDENTNFIPYFNGKNLFKETNENIDAIKLNINQFHNSVIKDFIL